MKGKAEKVLGIILALMSLGLLTTMVPSQPNDLPEKRSTKQDQLVHTIQPRLAQNYGKRLLSFEANQGQTDARVRFLARGGGYTIFLTDDEAVLTLRKSSVVSGQSSVAPTGTRPDLFGRFAGARVAPRSIGAALPDLLSLSMPKGKSENEVEKPRDRRAGPALPFSSSRLAGSGESMAVFRMRLIGANASAKVTGADELPGKSNYFFGNDPKKWRTNVPSYAQVKYEGVYPGVDLVYYGNQRQLEYDFVVAPGADPNQIKLSFAGADGMRVDAASGDLVLKLGDDEVRFHKPAVSQPTVAAVSSPPSKPVAALSERRRRSETAATAELDGAFVLASNNQVAFRVAGYDPKRALVIDPVLVYSTYLGGSGIDEGTAIAVDAAGSAYLTGDTQSVDFPTANALQATCCGGTWHVYVAKLNPTGSALVYSTYLGGSNTDYGTGIAVDAAGSAYVTGITQSTDFPTANPLQPSYGGGLCDAFVAKLNAAGSALVYSTYLGGSGDDYGNGIAADAAGNAHVAGGTTSGDFPTANPLQATFGGYIDAFVAKINAAGSALVYSTYLGGSAYDSGVGIALDSSGNAYVTGITSSTDFPTVNPLQATNHGGAYDAFVAKLNAAGSALVYSTYLGGSGRDQAQGIAVDSSGNAYVTGWTESGDFPTANALQAVYGGGSEDAFVAKLNPAGSALVYSTYLGGSGVDQGMGTAVDSSGNAYVAGLTTSTDFPTANPLQPSYGGGLLDAFVAELNPTGSVLVYSTYLGGSSIDQGYAIAVDSSGNAYVTGVTSSTDFPTINPLQATNHGGAYDAFVAKISAAGGAPSVGLSPASLTFGAQNVGATSAPQTETVTNTGTANLSISTVTVGGANASDFATSNDTCTGATVTPNSACTISVTFTPSAMGSYSASLNFIDNTSNSPQTVTLSGTGTAPLVSLSASGLTFGSQLLNTTSAAQMETVTNIGTANLTISTVTIGGTNANDFAKSADTCMGATVAPNGACSIGVTFTPVGRPGLGAQTGFISITDNAAGSPQSISLLGTGIDTVPPTISISANPSSLWPPNGKSVPVTVSGTITDSGSGVNPSTLACKVVDSYGLVQPACSVGSLGAGGAYSFTVSLVASRNGNDKNGRTYTISVSASDYAGNSASVSTAVIVPHDQGN